MLKKISISVMGLILLASITLAGYKVFEPKSTSKLETTINSFYIEFSNVKEYTLSGGNNTSHYYFFCIPEDNNCKYVYDSVFLSVKDKNNDVSLDTIFEYIDINDIKDKDNFHNLLNQWGISTYPALVSCKVENDKIVINNVLEYDEKNPLSDMDIINWMRLNGIYSGNLQQVPH